MDSKSNRPDPVSPTKIEGLIPLLFLAAASCSQPGALEAEGRSSKPSVSPEINQHPGGRPSEDAATLGSNESSPGEVVGAPDDPESASGGHRHSGLSLTIPVVTDLGRERIEAVVEQLIPPYEAKELPEWHKARLREAGLLIRHRYPTKNELLATLSPTELALVSSANLVNSLPSALPAHQLGPLFQGSRLVQEEDFVASDGLMLLALDTAPSASASLDAVQAFWGLRASGVSLKESVPMFFPDLPGEEAVRLVLEVGASFDTSDLGSIEARSKLVDERLEQLGARRDGLTVEPSSTSSASRPWQRHEDRTKGFEISFPGHWTIKPGRGANTYVKGVFHGSDRSLRLVAVERLPFPDGVTLADLNDLALPDYTLFNIGEGSRVDPQSIEKIRLGRTAAVTTTLQISNTFLSGRAKQWIIHRPDGIWRVYGCWNGDLGAWPQVMREFDSVASTFELRSER